MAKKQPTYTPVEGVTLIVADQPYSAGDPLPTVSEADLTAWLDAEMITVQEDAR